MTKKFKMTTKFGKRRRWEIQRLLINRRVFYRLTGHFWCMPATHAEIALWKLTGMEFGREG
jgi:hypothetical protein